MRKNFLKNYFIDENDSHANRTKFIHNRVKMVEKFIPELGKAVFDYIDKAAKSRDCCDKIALVLNEYSKAEKVTSTFKSQIEDFANILVEVGTSKDLKIQTVETKVMEQLGEYDKLCKGVQSELKLLLIASDKERTWVKQLKRIKDGNPHDLEQIAIAEAEFIKAKGESTKMSKNLEEQIDIFERRRLNAIKQALLAWATAELQFHSKALQLFTDAYCIAADIDVSVDVEEFRNKLRLTEETPRSDSLQRSESVLQLITLPFHKKTKFTGNGIPHPSSIQSSLPSSISSSVSTHR